MSAPRAKGYSPSPKGIQSHLLPYADRARALTPQIKVALHFTITGAMSDTQVVHQLLSQLGLKLTLRWFRSFPGYEGEKLRVYQLDTEHWEQVWAILQRRQAKRQAASLPDNTSEPGSSVSLKLKQGAGDPGENLLAQPLANQVHPITENGAAWTATVRSPSQSSAASSRTTPGFEGCTSGFGPNLD